MRSFSINGMHWKCLLKNGGNFVVASKCLVYLETKLAYFAFDPDFRGRSKYLLPLTCPLIYCQVATTNIFRIVPKTSGTIQVWNAVMANYKLKDLSLSNVDRDALQTVCFISYMSLYGKKHFKNVINIWQGGNDWRTNYFGSSLFTTHVQYISWINNKFDDTLASSKNWEADQNPEAKPRAVVSFPAR